MRSHLLRLSASILVLVIAGCTTSRTPTPSASLHQSSEEESAWAFFLDTGDAGDDIWTPGCHFKCTDSGCAGEKEFWGGDFCSGNDLQEWTNSEPHAAESDIVRHNCDEACKQKGSSGGRCVTVEKACDDAYQSSRCECD